MSSSVARVVYVNEERPFGDHTEVVRGRVAAGEWKVVNAPRPLPGDIAWTGPFRCGVFYAAGAPSVYSGGWENLDAAYVEEIDNAEIRRRLEARAEEAEVSLEEAIEASSIEWIAAGYGWPWRS